MMLQPTDFNMDHGGCSCLHDARRDWADGLTAAATCVLPALYLRASLTLPFRRNFRALQSSTHDKRPAAEGERRALHPPVYEENMRAFLSKNLRDSLLRVRGLRRLAAAPDLTLLHFRERTTPGLRALSGTRAAAGASSSACAAVRAGLSCTCAFRLR